MFKHLSSREIKVKWAWIQKSKKGSLFNKLVVKSGLKNVNFPRKTDNHYKIGNEASPRFTQTFPTFGVSFQGYDNPQPSTSTWPQSTVPVIRERDPLKLESPTSSSDRKEPYRQHQILGNSSSDTESSPATSESYYSPETEPVSPCQTGANAPDMISHCMREANLGTQTDNEPMVELPVI